MYAIGYQDNTGATWFKSRNGVTTDIRQAQTYKTWESAEKACTRYSNKNRNYKYDTTEGWKE